MISLQTSVLVVDDFEPMRKVISGQLRLMGAGNILTANNGAEALHILQNRRIDIVLADLNMPIMTGLELLKAVRSDKKLSRLPFIMITAESERESVEEAIASGVTDLLVKPYTAKRLTDRVEKALTFKSRSNSPVRTTPIVRHEIPAFVHESQKPDRLTLLAVDDAPDNLHLLTNLFKDDYRVRIAQSGKKALEICQSNNPPDLVLLDIMMPGMDGFEVARLMREHPTSEAIPVIFITAMTDENSRIKGLDLGAVDFVTKPINALELKPRVQNFMRYVELHRQLQNDYDGMLEAARLHEDVEHITRHDMKGPLAGVIGLVQALEDDKSMGRKQIEQLRAIEEAALKVLNMINLFSELFKIETGRFKLDARPVKIGEILRRIVEIDRTVFADKNIAIIAIDTDVLHGETPPQLLGDAMLCYSLFQNLLKNACEAAPENSRVAITMMDENPLRFIITNKGTVPAEIREHFFDKFVTSGKQEGSGLGTYSAKLLTEAQNGSISLAVSDTKNETTLSVTLPRYAEVIA